MTRLIAVAAAALLGLAATVEAQERGAEHRGLGAHQHGHGTLNIAAEGRALRMELEVPGDDIVGFEHAAATEDEKARLDSAKAALARPLDVVKLPDAAKCTVKNAEVTMEDEHHEHEPEGAGAPHELEAQHTAFHVEAVLDCAAIDQLTAMDFAYFKRFTNAQSLTVTIIAPNGQSTFEATRDKPVIDLGGLM